MSKYDIQIAPEKKQKQISIITRNNMMIILRNYKYYNKKKKNLQP